MVIGAALTIVSLPYIQCSTSEFDCCQKQIRGRWISILIMKQTEMASDLLTKFKGRHHQSQLVIFQPTFFFLITLWLLGGTDRFRKVLKLLLRLAYKYKTKEKASLFGHLKSKILDNQGEITIKSNY